MHEEMCEAHQTGHGGGCCEQQNTLLIDSRLSQVRCEQNPFLPLKWAHFPCGEAAISEPHWLQALSGDVPRDTSRVQQVLQDRFISWKCV